MAVPSTSHRPSAAGVPVLAPQGSHAGKPSLPLGRAFTLVGSRHRAHLHLLSRTVSKSHAAIINTQTGSYIRDLASRERVFVNNRQVLEADLNGGDTVKIGSFTFKYSDAPGIARPLLGRKAPAATLHVDGAPMPLPIEGRTVVIGRRPNCDVPLMELSASTIHAIIFEINGKRYVRDLGSRTGTFVNGNQIQQHPLEPGDVIKVGESELRYVVSPDQVDLDEFEPLEHVSPPISMEPGSGRGEVAAIPLAPAAAHSAVSKDAEGLIPLAGEDESLAVVSPHAVTTAAAAALGVAGAAVAINLNSDPDVAGSAADFAKAQSSPPDLLADTSGDGDRQLLVSSDLYGEKLSGSGSFADMNAHAEEGEDEVHPPVDLDWWPEPGVGTLLGASSPEPAPATPATAADSVESAPDELIPMATEADAPSAIEQAPPVAAQEQTLTANSDAIPIVAPIELEMPAVVEQPAPVEEAVVAAHEEISAPGSDIAPEAIADQDLSTTVETPDFLDAEPAAIPENTLTSNVDVLAQTPLEQESSIVVEAPATHQPAAEADPLAEPAEATPEVVSDFEIFDIHSADHDAPIVTPSLPTEPPELVTPPEASSTAEQPAKVFEGEVLEASTDEPFDLEFLPTTEPTPESALSIEPAIHETSEHTAAEPSLDEAEVEDYSPLSDTSFGRALEEFASPLGALIEEPLAEAAAPVAEAAAPSVASAGDTLDIAEPSTVEAAAQLPEVGVAAVPVADAGLGAPPDFSGLLEEDGPTGDPIVDSASAFLAFEAEVAAEPPVDAAVELHGEVTPLAESVNAHSELIPPSPLAATVEDDAQPADVAPIAPVVPESAPIEIPLEEISTAEVVPPESIAAETTFTTAADVLAEPAAQDIAPDEPTPVATRTTFNISSTGEEISPEPQPVPLEVEGEWAADMDFSDPADAVSEVSAPGLTEPALNVEQPVEELAAIEPESSEPLAVAEAHDVSPAEISATIEEPINIVTPEEPTKYWEMQPELAEPAPAALDLAEPKESGSALQVAEIDNPSQNEGAWQNDVDFAEENVAVEPPLELDEAAEFTSDELSLADSIPEELPTPQPVASVFTAPIDVIEEPAAGEIYDSVSEPGPSAFDIESDAPAAESPKPEFDLEQPAAPADPVPPMRPSSPNEIFDLMAGMNRDFASFMGGMPVNIAAAPVPGVAPVNVVMVPNAPVASPPPTLGRVGQVHAELPPEKIIGVPPMEEPPELFENRPATLDDLPDELEPIHDVTQAVGERPAPSAPQPQPGVRPTAPAPIRTKVVPPPPARTHRAITQFDGLEKFEDDLDIITSLPDEPAAPRGNPTGAFDGLALDELDSIDAFSLLPMPSANDSFAGGVSNVAAEESLTLPEPDADNEPPARTTARPLRPPPARPADMGGAQRAPEALPDTTTRTPQPPPRKRKRWKFFGVFLLATSLGASGVVWQQWPDRFHSTGAIRFAGFENLSPTDQRMVIDPILGNKLLTRAAAVSREHGTDPGFLDDRLAVDQVMQTLHVQASDTLVVSHDGRDGDADRVRLSALLTAVYESNQYLADEALARQRRIAEIKLALANGETELQNSKTRDKQASKRQKAALAEEVAAKALAEHEAAFSVASRKVADLEVVVKAETKPRGVRSHVETDAQVFELSDKVKELDAQLAAAQVTPLDTAHASQALTVELADYKKKIESALTTAKATSAVAAYLSSALQVCLELQTAQSELLNHNATNSYALADLSRQRTRALDAKRQAAYSADAPLAGLQQQWSVKDRQANTAADANFPEEATRFRSEANMIRTQIDRRKATLFTPAAGEDDKQQADAIRAQAQTEQTAFARQLAGLFKKAADAQPAANGLAPDQLAAVDTVSQKLKLVKEAGDQLVHSFDPPPQDPQAIVRQLKDQRDAAQAKLDTRVKQILDESLKAMDADAAQLASASTRSAELNAVRQVANNAREELETARAAHDRKVTALAEFPKDLLNYAVDNQRDLEIEKQAPALQQEMARLTAQHDIIPQPLTADAFHVEPLNPAQRQQTTAAVGAIGVVLFAMCWWGGGSKSNTNQPIATTGLNLTGRPQFQNPGHNPIYN